MIRLLQLTLVLLSLLPATRLIAGETVLVAVAANFAPVAEELGYRFTNMTGEPVKFSTGASGTLARQIRHGAPFQLFLSADEKYVDTLAREGLTVDKGRIYALGVLVLYLPWSSGLNRMQDIGDILKQLVAEGRFKVALANPAIAPYGLAARHVLDRFDKDNRLAGRMIIGENVGQAAQYALTDNVDAALIPYSLALNKDMQAAGNFEMIPADWYPPVRQRMVLLRSAGSAAKEFYQYLDSETARQVIRNYGYALPEQRTED